MSTANCEKKVVSKSGGSGKVGIVCYFATKKGDHVNCDITPTSSRLDLVITNHKTTAVGVRVWCESKNGRVEFKKNGTYSDTLESSLFLEARGLGKPTTIPLDVDIQPSTSSNQPEEIRPKVNIIPIVLTPNPTISEKVDVNVVPNP